jgi:2-dehydro-3-deoxygluconokinase
VIPRSWAGDDRLGHEDHARHGWGAVAWVAGNRYVSPACELEVLDRVGGGDGFASGIFCGCSPATLSTKHCGSVGRMDRSSPHFPGDTTTATFEQVQALADGRNARIQR